MKKLFRCLSILLFFASFVYVCKVSDLMNTGYDFKSAQLIALVELHIIPANDLYNALMED